MIMSPKRSFRPDWRVVIGLSLGAIALFGCSSGSGSADSMVDAAFTNVAFPVECGSQVLSDADLEQLKTDLGVSNVGGNISCVDVTIGLDVLPFIEVVPSGPPSRNHVVSQVDGKWIDFTDAICSPGFQVPSEAAEKWRQAKLSQSRYASSPDLEEFRSQVTDALVYDANCVPS